MVLMGIRASPVTRQSRIHVQFLRHGIDPWEDHWVGKIPWRRKWLSIHSSILAWEIHGQRNLADYSPWGYKESDTTEVTEHACVPDLHMEVKGDKSEIPQILN